MRLLKPLAASECPTFGLVYFLVSASCCKNAKKEEKREFVTYRANPKGVSRVVASTKDFAHCSKLYAVAHGCTSPVALKVSCFTKIINSSLSISL